MSHRSCWKWHHDTRRWCRDHLWEPWWCRPTRKHSGVSHYHFMGICAVGNIVLTHGGFHTRASEQDGRARKTENEREERMRNGVFVRQRGRESDGWWFFFRWGPREFVGGKKSKPPLSKVPYRPSHTCRSGVAVRPVSLLILFPLPPSISFHRTYQRHSELLFIGDHCPPLSPCLSLDLCVFQGSFNELLLLISMCNSLNAIDGKDSHKDRCVCEFSGRGEGRWFISPVQLFPVPLCRSTSDCCNVFHESLGTHKSSLESRKVCACLFIYCCGSVRMLIIHTQTGYYR